MFPDETPIKFILEKPNNYIECDGKWSSTAHKADEMYSVDKLVRVIFTVINIDVIINRL